MSAERRGWRGEGRWGAVIGAVLLVVSACSDPARPSEQQFSAALPQRIVVRPGTSREGEALFRSIASAVPTFGGFYFEPLTGELIVLVSADSDRVATASAVRRIAGELPLDGRSGSRVVTPAVRVRVVPYTFRQLAAWRDTLSDEVFANANARALFIDIPRNLIVVGVPDGRAQRLAADIRERLGIPASATEIASVQVGSSSAELLLSPGDSLTSLLRPTDGGARIRFVGETTGCTLMLGVTYGGTGGFLTNSPCSSVVGSVSPPTVYFQPEIDSPAFANRIG